MLCTFNLNGRKSVRQIHHKVRNLDIDYICSSENLLEIEENIHLRKGIGNIRLVQKLFDSIRETISDEKENTFVQEILKIPNRTHSAVKSYEDPKVLKLLGNKRTFSSKPLDFHDISKRLNLMRVDQLGNFSGSKSYYVLGCLANLDRALKNYAIKTLSQNEFELISVPDVIPKNLVEKCGAITAGTRNQVFVLHRDLHKLDMCLSGTSEISLGGLFENHTFEEEELPVKLAAVSRCYRAESSNLSEERGLYRVHEFTKVEMFMIVAPEKSDESLEYIRNIQEEHFGNLDLHMKVLDMPPYELGASAYRKYDIEAWLPGKGFFGEISSCSNCADYQSRRLGIKYRSKNGQVNYVHTLNGTASAIPRLLIALIESGQREDGCIRIPTVLHKFMYGSKTVGKQNNIPQLKLNKYNR